MVGMEENSCRERVGSKKREFEVTVEVFTYKYKTAVNSHSTYYLFS